MSRSRSRYSERSYIIIGVVTLVVIVYVARLFYVQVLSPEYKLAAENIAFYHRTLYPSRGLMRDRNDSLVVYNTATADAKIVMRQMEDFDSLAFCRILDIELQDLRDRLDQVKDRESNRGYSPFVPQTLFSQITSVEAGLLEEQLYKFPGLLIEHHTSRAYRYTAGALLLGNIGEVGPGDIKRDPYYTPGDYAGTTGLEKSYERFLRGNKGTSILLRDVHGRVQGQYEEGKYDQELTSGHDLKLSIDIKLQAYGEKLMQGKSGAIVMIEPSTGEVLALVSSPSFDPARLVGKERGRNYQQLVTDPSKPLYNRATQAAYPPGSTFKTVQAAAYLQEGCITPGTMYSCYRGYPLLRGRPRCHGHGSPLDLRHAIATSCNAYFCWGLRAFLDDRSRYATVEEAFDHWRDYIVKMGFGHKTGVDLPGESRGYIPNSEVYDKIHNGRWTSSSIVSISIGQGEILATPMQIANFGAIVANRGHYYTPHLVKEINGMPQDSLYVERMETGIRSEYFQVIAEGMRMAVTGGTCRKANLSDFAICGKTGTAENPHGKDHSLFLGFGPMESPKVSIAVMVENGGFGATYAVPIGRLMLDYYLHGDSITPSSTSYEKAMLSTVIR